MGKKSETMTDINEKITSEPMPEEKEYRELVDDELEDVAGGYDFQIHRFRYHDGSIGEEPPQQPTVYGMVKR